MGINTTNPAYKLDVNGVIRSSGTMYVSGAPQTSYYYYACFDGSLGLTYGTTCSGSDIRLKENIEPITNGLDRTLRTKGVTFEWKDKNRGNRREVGFIAQDMEKAVPEVVSTGPDGTKGIDYQKLTAVLAEAIKELKAENDNHAIDLRALRDEFRAYKDAHP